MADTDLLTCPFCGGERASAIPANRNSTERLYPIVRCMGCFTDVPGKTDDFSLDCRTAIAAWNRRAPSPSPAPGMVTGQAAGNAESPLEWAVGKWHREVANRPLKNIHRAALDTTWRQVIRHFGGDAEALCGPDHYTLVEQNPSALASLSQPAKGEREGDGE